MTKETLSQILGIAALLAADTAISIFCVRGYYKEKYEKALQEDKDSLRALREQYVSMMREAEDAVNMAERQAQDITLYRHKMGRYAPKNEVDPAEEEYPGEPVLSEKEEMDLAGERITRELDEDSDRDCEEIHISEFGENPVFATETLTYYIYDDILVDDQEMVIDRPADLVGDVLLESGYTQNGQDNIYIRNYRLRTDYEIVKTYAGFENYS